MSSWWTTSTICRKTEVPCLYGRAKLGSRPCRRMTYEERLILLAGPQFQAAKSARPVGFSLVVNALCPFLRMFQRRYPQGSIVPLLYPTIFPAIGIVPSVVRKRTLDAIAAVAMRGLVKHIVVTIPARSAGVTRVVRPFACAIIALALIVSASIGLRSFLWSRLWSRRSHGCRQTRASAVIRQVGGDTRKMRLLHH